MIPEFVLLFPRGGSRPLAGGGKLYKGDCPLDPPLLFPTTNCTLAVSLLFSLLQLQQLIQSVSITCRIKIILLMSRDSYVHGTHNSRQITSKSCLCLLQMSSFPCNKFLSTVFQSTSRLLIQTVVKDNKVIVIVTSRFLKRYLKAKRTKGASKRGCKRSSGPISRIPRGYRVDFIGNCNY